MEACVRNMASVNEAFTNPDVAQGEFYSAQQIRYRETEPNRFLPDKMKGNLGPRITNDTLSQFNTYDPYTETVSNKFTNAGISQILQGQGQTTDEETYCRGFMGAASIPKLLSDQEAQGNLPIRCGWRYKKSPGGGIPLVSQGALGTINGPLNAQGDSLGNGVEWIWDLRKAYNRHAKDFTATLPASSAGLATAQATFSNVAWCSQSNRYILVNESGRPLAGYTCGQGSIVTNPNNFPQTTPTSASSLVSANAQTLATCMRPGNNPALSRECLLQAIKTNGCSTEGALYQAIESAKPTASTYSQYLQTQPSFQTYQSRQGDNKITEDLFNKERGSWDMATREIQKLQRYTQLNQDPLVKVAAEDLCLGAGKFDSYDFCSDITENTNIGAVDLKCMQNYWQEKNGKPAGLLYPSTKTLKPELGSILTWGQYRNAVDQLKNKVNSTDPLEQRKAVNNFLGVIVSSDPFSPLNLDGVSRQLSLGGQPLQFWIDAKDGGSLVIDQNNRVRTWNDKSGRNNNLTQNSIINRPIFKQEAFPGLEFNGSDTFLPIPNAARMVSGTFTIFVVERRKSSKAPNYFLGGLTPSPFSAGSSDWLYYRLNPSRIPNTQTNGNLVLGYRNNNTATMAFFNNDVDVRVPNFQQTLEPIRIWTFEKNTTGRNVYVNGERIGGDNNLATMIGWNGAAVGRFDTSFYQGMIYEVIIFNPVLSVDRRQKVEGYLAHKWGQATNMVAGHPFKTAAP